MDLPEKKIRVLYIDDEQNNLLAFNASFRRQFEVFTAMSAAEGMKVKRARCSCNYC